MPLVNWASKNIVGASFFCSWYPFFSMVLRKDHKENPRQEKRRRRTLQTTVATTWVRRSSCELWSATNKVPFSASSRSLGLRMALVPGRDVKEIGQSLVETVENGGFKPLPTLAGNGKGGFICSSIYPRCKHVPSSSSSWFSKGQSRVGTI